MSGASCKTTFSRTCCFSATEFGLFFTVDGGQHWVKLTGNVPTIPFRDLEIQQRENDLVGASFGRGFFVLDDYSPLRGISEDRLAEPFLLFPVKEAWQYIPARVLGGRKGSQGDALFTAPNPPFGAIFTYYLRDSLKTRKQLRQEKEAEAKKAGGDNPYPGFDELKKEEREEDPALILSPSRTRRARWSSASRDRPGRVFTEWRGIYATLRFRPTAATDRVSFRVPTRSARPSESTM